MWRWRCEGRGCSYKTESLARQMQASQRALGKEGGAGCSWELHQLRGKFVQCCSHCF